MAVHMNKASSLSMILQDLIGTHCLLSLCVHRAVEVGKSVCGDLVSPHPLVVVSYDGRPLIFDVYTWAATSGGRDRDMSGPMSIGTPVCRDLRLRPREVGNTEGHDLGIIRHRDIATLRCAYLCRPIPREAVISQCRARWMSPPRTVAITRCRDIWVSRGRDTWMS